MNKKNITMSAAIFALLVVAAIVLWVIAALLVPAALIKFCWTYLTA